ncbi:MAG: DUF1036 domain-containing protein [Hyphomicrobiales bacterium]|nr:DUF1036 domain-containing protein [Hyphomicrobiales bacterium]
MKQILATLVLMMGISLPAMANFRICNHAAARISTAIAYNNGKAWVSSGWWNIKPSACEEILRGPLTSEFYYIYAMDEHGGEWKGKTMMCTLARSFKITGGENCYTRGYERTGFIAIDTGKEAKNWTVDLTDPNAPSQPATPVNPALPKLVVPAPTPKK